MDCLHLDSGAPMGSVHSEIWKGPGRTGDVRRKEYVVGAVANDDGIIFG
jgi:hypothetical protein